MTTQVQEARIWDKQSVLDLLASNDKAVGKALWALYQRQTAAEQASETTTDRNNRGFNGRDAGFLSSVASKLPRYDYRLTERQLKHVRRMLKKYWRQLLEEIEAKGGKVDYKADAPSIAPEAVEQPEEAEAPVVAPPVQPARSDQFGLF